MVCVPEVNDFVELFALNHSVVNDIVESIVRAPHGMRLIGYRPEHVRFDCGRRIGSRKIARPLRCPPHTHIFTPAD